MFFVGVFLFKHLYQNSREPLGLSIKVSGAFLQTFPLQTYRPTRKAQTLTSGGAVSCRDQIKHTGQLQTIHFHPTDPTAVLRKR